MTSVGVVANASKRLDGGLAELRRSLAEYGLHDLPWHEVPKSKYVPERVEELVEQGVDLLFVWGGDGTVQRAIDVVAGKPVALSILPAGTANLLARNLGLPDDLDACVRVGLEGARRDLDVGKVNGEHFAVMAGAGLDAMMIREADGGLKEHAGRIAYVWSGARNVRLEPVATTIEVDGERWYEGQASCVLIGNVGDVFGGLSVFPEAAPDDGVLDIGVVTADGAWEWARTLGRAIVGDVSASPFVHTTTGRAFVVRLDPSTPYQLDGGDRKASKKLKVKVKPSAVTVCVPEGVPS
ncbi:MAG TPA: diacylglycerol kinase family protein [Actinomycetota bacterium]